MNNPFDFRDKKVVVTGGASGIGAAISRRFAEAGADLCVHYRSSSAEAEEFINAGDAFEGKIVAVQADLSRPEGVISLMEETAEILGGISVLINNAGIYPMADLAGMELEEWKRMIDINLTTPFLCIREALCYMKPGSSVVNIGSVEAENPNFAHSHYTASKGGLVMFTRAAAKELGPKGIRVNSVSPGLIYKEGLAQAWPEGIAGYLDEAPLGRLGTGTDVADACLFLSSPAASWISGINLRVDGGLLASRGY